MGGGVRPNPTNPRILHCISTGACERDLVTLQIVGLQEAQLSTGNRVTLCVG